MEKLVSTVGVISFILLIVIAICLIWFPSEMTWRLFATVGVLFIACGILQKALEEDEDSI